ncbi:MAG: hypothetical protein BM555_03515 [Crocinitomix sp. MedPE-SWsnd]|nr:MAG: hypothetical protein BM555_03515 [Crocinitomix sp. MedPE-SWsnd]
MSKEFKNIDELFKAELGGTTAKAPAHVKANIDKAIGFGGRKKLLWFLLPLVVIGIATPLLYNQFSADTDNNLAITDSIESQNSSSSANENELSSSTEITTDNSSNGMSDKNGANAPENNSTTDNQTNDSHLTNSDEDQNSTFDSNSNSQKSNLDKTDSKFSSNKVDDNGIKKTVNTDKIIKKDEKPELVDTKTKDDDLVTKSDDKKVIPDDIQATQIDSSLIEKDELADVKKSSSDSLIDPSDEINDNTLNPSDSLINNNSTNDMAEVDSTLEQPDINIDVPNEKYNPWILTTTAGINLKKSNLTIPTTGDSMSSFHNINDKMGHSAQIDIAYRMKNSLTFGAGIGYSSFIENYTYFKEENVLTDTLFTWVYTQDSMQDTNMNWIYWQDSTQNESYVYENQEVYNANGTNHNTYLNIPISIGTNLDFGKFRWDLYAQGRFNLLLRSRTTYVEADQIIVVPQGSFKNSYFDLIVGTNLHYNIFGNLYVTGTVRYKAPTSKVYYPTLTNRFQNVHVGVGFSLNF